MALDALIREFKSHVAFRARSSSNASALGELRREVCTDAFAAGAPPHPHPPYFRRTVRAWYIWSAFDSFRESGREFLERRLQFPRFCFLFDEPGVNQQEE
jgi:hypothetical protein